jgi:hypothetical protein
MNAERGADEEVWERLREQIARNAEPTPTYAEFLERSDHGHVPAHAPDNAAPPWTARAAVIFLVIATGLGLLVAARNLANPPTETATIPPPRIHILTTPPAGAGGPDCWASFQDGGLSGGCRTGTLKVTEFSDIDGNYVDGWNNHATFVAVPAGWEAHSYHQNWNLAPAELAQRQGFVLHREGTTDLSESQPIFRDPDNLNWDYCRTWNQALFNAGPADSDTELDNNMQCLHIDPGVDEPLVIGDDDRATSSRLELEYVPSSDTQTDE